MSLFCVVAGLLGHATVLEPMGVSDILGGVPSVHANDAARSSGASEASKAAKPSAGTCLPICHAEKHKAWSVKCAWAERCKGCDECTGPPNAAATAAAKAGAAAAAAKAGNKPGPAPTKAAKTGAAAAAAKAGNKPGPAPTKAAKAGAAPAAAKAGKKPRPAPTKAAKPSGGACLPICYTEEHKAWSVKCAWAERCKGCDECTGPPSDAAGAAAKTTGAAAAAAKAGARTQGDEVFVGGPRDLGSGDTSSELGSGDTSSDLGSGDTSTSAPTGSSAAPTSSPDIGSGEPSAGGAAPEGECADGFSRSYAGANCAGGAGSEWESEHGNTGCDCTDGVCTQCCKEEAISDDGEFNCTWAAPRTCFEPEASFVPDDGCSEGYSRTYTGSNCMGTEAWEAANGNNACECTDGVCAKCCKEECNANGTHTCSWQEPKTCVATEVVADEACADGFSRSYAGANCAGGAGSEWESEHGNTGCDCTDGVCTQCCKEECTDDNSHVCYWEAPQTCVSNDGQPVDDHCPSGYTRAYAGVNCAGGAGSAYESEHGDTGCDCTDGVCTQCCKEECFEDNTHACSWAPVKTCFSNEGAPADPACPTGFSRTYIGTNCAGTEAWVAEHGNAACDCTDGVCEVHIPSL